MYGSCQNTYENSLHGIRMSLVLAAQRAEVTHATSKPKTVEMQTNTSCLAGACGSPNMLPVLLLSAELGAAPNLPHK